MYSPRKPGLTAPCLSSPSPSATVCIVLLAARTIRARAPTFQPRVPRRNLNPLLPPFRASKTCPSPTRARRYFAAVYAILMDIGVEPISSHLERLDSSTGLDTDSVVFCILVLTALHSLFFFLLFRFYISGDIQILRSRGYV